MKKLLKNFIGYLKIDQLLEFLRAKHSATRRMAWLFVICCIGIIAVSIVLVKLFKAQYDRAHSHQEIIPVGFMELEAIKKLENERYDFKKQMELSLELGKFTVELDHPNADEFKGAIDLAEVEVSVITDTRETQEYLRTHLVETRDQVTRVLTAIPRRELMSREGKRKINIKILRKLNHWLRRDAITEAYISNLLVD